MTNALRYRYPLRLPASLKDTAARLAKEDGVSLNQWIVTAVAQKIGAVETAEVFLRERAGRSVFPASSNVRTPIRPRAVLSALEVEFS